MTCMLEGTCIPKTTYRGGGGGEVNTEHESIYAISLLIHCFSCTRVCAVSGGVLLKHERAAPLGGALDLEGLRGSLGRSESRRV